MYIPALKSYIEFLGEINNNVTAKYESVRYLKYDELLMIIILPC